MTIKSRIQAFTKKLFRRKTQSYIREPTVLEGPYFSAATTDGNRGNQFRTYENMVAATWQRMAGEAQYGNDIIREVVRYLSSWISGNGASITGRTQQDNKFLDEFVRRNALDSWFLNRITKGGIIEGRILLWYRPVKVETENGPDVQFDVKYIRWNKYKYKVITSPTDDQEILRVEFDDADNKKIVLQASDIVYINFDNTGQNINKPTPLIDGHVLTHAVNMGKALADWRDYNHFWGALGLHFETKDRADAEEIRGIISAHSKWALGDTLAAPAKAYFPEPSGAGVSSFEKELTTYARVLSGITGVPLYLLGYASDLSNRATAEELTESIYSTSSEPRDIMKFGLEELVKKVIEKRNQITGLTMSSLVDVTLAQVTRHQIKELLEVWAPLHDMGHISQDTLMAKIPGIDVRQELKKIEKEKEGNMERQAQLISMMGDNNEEEDEEEVA